MNSSLSPPALDVAAEARRLLARRELERRQAQRDPAYLVSFMSALDERTGEIFTFEHLRNAEAAEGHPWGWQRDYFLWLYEELRSITLKARQIGATWLGCAACVADVLRFPGSLDLIYRQKEEEAQENVTRCWRLLNSLPKHLWMGAEVLTPTKGAEARAEIRLRFGGKEISRILAMTSASVSGHGKTARRALLDEHSRIERAGEIMKAIGPAVGSQGHASITSTANGRSNPETGEGNQFHWLWTHAEEAGFEIRFLPWGLHPDRDQAWYDRSPEVRSLRPHERAEQFPSNPHEAFTLTSRTWFDPEDLDFYRGKVMRPKRRFDFVPEGPRQASKKESSRGLIKVFREPVESRKYAIGCDVATGRGTDYSAAYVVDLGDMSIAAELHGRLDADKYAYQLHYLGRWYQTALIAVEMGGGFGEAVVIPLRDGREGRPAYPNLYRHVLSSRPDQPWVKPFGFPVNLKTRPLILSQIEKAVRDRLLPGVSDRLLEEMENFVHHDHGTSPRAQEGSHDDCVMACAIALEMYRLRGQHPEYKRRHEARQRTKRAKKTLYPWMAPT